MNKKTYNMTSGNIRKHIIMFSLPLMMGNIFQQIYTVADAAIIGRGLGVSALAAVGTLDWYSWMILACIQGLCMGFGVLISQAFGSGDEEGLKKITGNAIILSLIAAILFLIFTQTMTGTVLHLLRTPDDIISTACMYARFLYAGIPAVVAYNMMSSLLRSLGNSKAPLTAVVIASMANIVLDILFVIVFDFGVQGAAIATVISQIISCIYCYLFIRKIDILQIKADNLKINLMIIGKLLYLGIPMSLQNVLIAVGGMFVQSIINTFGVVYIAGFVALNKIYGVIEIAATAFGYAMATFTGQNLGAKKIDRIKKGVASGFILNTITSVIIAALLIIFGRHCLSLFIDPSSANATNALDIGYFFLKSLALLLPGLYYVHLFRNVVEGLGNSIIPMLSGIAELAARCLSAIILPMFFAPKYIIWTEMIAWFSADFILVLGYFIVMRSLNKSFSQEI